MTAKYVLAIDQGTTGSTCLVFDHDAQLVGRAYRELEQHFPRPGLVEHDPREIWETTRAVALEALADAGVPDGGLSAIPPILIGPAKQHKKVGWSIGPLCGPTKTRQ